jgi:hypothetical protein
MKKRLNYRELYNGARLTLEDCQADLRRTRERLDIAELNIKNLQTDNRMWMGHVIVLGRAIDKLITAKKG